MRVLLVNPPYTAEDRYGKDLGKFGPLNEPLGLAYLAANLERGGHEVSILDAPALDLTSTGICKSIEAESYDLIGVTMLTPMYRRSIEVVRAIKKAFPKLPIVVGGPHPTILPEETLIENKEIDFAVIGEGEIVFLNFVNALEKGEDTEGIPGIAYRKNDSVVVNKPPEMIAHLDDLPIPARHLLPMHAYHMTESRTQAEHAFTVSVSRGCPFNCAFCCRIIFGRKVRHHSVDRIIDEITTLVNDYGAKEINLEADTLTVNKHFINSLCEKIIASGLSKKITWTCESRIDTINKDMLKKMREAGCWEISYGVETGSQRLLDLIHKDISLEQIEKTFAITKRIGIDIRAFYMLGIPTETREESLKTIAFAKKLDARWSQFTVFTPFPGTELYDMVVKEGALKSHNWADYKTHGGWTKGGLAYVPRGRSVEEMKKLQKQAYRAVYLRPRVFLRFLRDINSIKKIKEYSIGFWVLLKTMLPSRDRLKAVRIKNEDLERFAQDVYVDSPVYFSPNRLVRFINWKKLDSVLSLLPQQERRSALDFGCGNGVMLPTLSGIFDTVIGIDIHTTAASRVIHEYSLSNVFLIRTNGLKLPFKDETFHTVVATSVLEHFTDLEKVVAEIARIIKPGGSLLFLSPTENMVYRFGRLLFGFKKPEDHYYSAREIELVLKTHLTDEVKRYFPIGFLPFFSAYRIGRFRKNS